MNRFVLPALTFLLLVVAADAPVAAQRIQVPPVTRQALDNGLQIILMEYRRVPVVHFRLVARGGSALDATGQEGIASLMASLLREGTATRTATEIAEAIDFVGGSLFTGAGLDYCAVRCEVLNKDLVTGLELFADVLLHPVFPQAELDRERKLRLAALESIKENPSAIASVVYTGTVYGSHPYGRQSFGTRASLEAMNRNHLEEFYRRIFTPNNSVLVVVGDFETATMLAKLTETFGAWQRGTELTMTIPMPEPLADRTVVAVNKTGLTQTQILIGNVGVDVGHPDLFAIRVANTIFGSGFTSRLVEEIRVKRSLTYGASSSFSSNLFGGTYTISTFTKNETVEETVNVILEELKKYRDRGATDEERKKSQNYLAGSFARSLQTPEALASRLTENEIYGFGQEYLERYIERIRAVTTADIHRVVRKHFLLENLLFLFVTPAEQTLPVIRKYGPVRTVELKDAVQ